jgi:PAS domain S-box-containing protein
VFFRDITARRKLEIAVAESEERYQRLFDSMLEGFAYCKMIYDDEGRAVDWLYLDANPAFSRLTGLRDVVGKRVLEVLPTTRADNPELLEAYERVAATGEPEEFEIDFRPLDMSLRVTALCPEPGHFVAIFENITARKTAENALLDTNLRLERMVYDVAESMGRIVEYRDPYTQGHEERVTEIARLLAQKMNLSEEEIAGIEMAAIVHDIGKLAVPAEILTKPGALSPIEFALIREHPAAGYGILKDIAFPWPVSDIVLQHHERLDGSGYPNGLAGEEICLGARIVAVADVVEAMASHRPYRPARGLAAALDEVTTKPELYDAAVVSALAELCDTGAVQL